MTTWSFGSDTLVGAVGVSASRSHGTAKTSTAVRMRPIPVSCIAITRKFICGVCHPASSP
jgi:hypothetical protein